MISLTPMSPVAGAAELSKLSLPALTNSVARLELRAPKSTVWRDGIGSGFLSSAHSMAVEAGVTLGMSKLGSHQAHDLALTSDIER